MIRAKFQCSEVKKTSDENEYVTLLAVTAGSLENREWSKWTPGGQFNITISNPSAQGKFIPGKNYFIDISEA